MDGHLTEGFLGDGFSKKGVSTEPGRVYARGVPIVDPIKVCFGDRGIDLGKDNGEGDTKLLVFRAVYGGTPLVEDTGDSKATREPNLSNIHNSGVKVFEDAMNIDVGEEIRWLYGVVSGARSSEVECGGD